MKKGIFILSSLLALTLLFTYACKKKKDEAIKPEYKADTGTGGNPDPNNVTTTGTTTFNPIPTENSSFYAGGAGWSNPSCITTSSLYLKANNGSTEVTVTFAFPPSIGTNTYLVASNVGAQSCVFTVLNAPGQPENIMWYGRSGSLQVTNTGTTVSASIIGSVRCEQSNFKFPSVTVAGILGCN
ncbi:MAG: hypothetical protein IPM51_06560 [Sphingobacteriaceae bacterium]|nr:hypothetical protein [Sphingobacteriaceae bacterium]